MVFGKGSTIIKLKDEYVKTLKPGEYILKVSYKNGTDVETTFKIAQNDNITNETTNTQPNDETNPPTGDNILVILVIFIFSIIGLVGTFILSKKTKENVSRI